MIIHCIADNIKCLVNDSVKIFVDRFNKTVILICGYLILLIKKLK